MSKTGLEIVSLIGVIIMRLHLSMQLPFVLVTQSAQEIGSFSGESRMVSDVTLVIFVTVLLDIQSH